MPRALFCGLLALSLSAIAQSTYSISGIVINSATGGPVKEAQVAIFGSPPFRPPAQPQPGAPARRTPSFVYRTILTDSSGKFQIDDLEEGNYQLTPFRPDFNSTTATPLDLHSSALNVTLSLAPFGVIEGTVLDQNGDPAPGVRVETLAISATLGKRSVRLEKSVSTDDHGAFRMWDLRSGKYYVRAAGRNAGAYSFVDDVVRAVPSWNSFEPVYAGGAHEMNNAQPIVVGTGTRANAVLTVTLEPAFKIRGTLQNVVPDVGLQFELFRGDDTVPFQSYLNSTTGEFQIEGITPGAYTLRVTQGSAQSRTRAEFPVTVKQADVSNLKLALLPGVTIKAMMHPAGNLASGAIQTLGSGAVRNQSCNVTLTPVARYATPTITLLRKPDAESEMAGVLPGVYRVSPGCPGYVTSMISGSIDLMANPDLTVFAGVAPAPIEITFTVGGGHLSGKLELDKGAQAAGVLLVPLFTPSLGPQFQRTFTGIPAGTSLSYNFFSLAPGEYMLYALSEENPEYAEPGFIQSLSRGTRVTVEDRGEQSVTLKSVSR